MRIQGHVAEGMVVAAVTVAVVQPQLHVADRAMLLGAVAGGLPDLDIVFYWLKKRSLDVGNDFRHHTWVTHTFPFYLIPALLFHIMAGPERPEWQFYAAVFALASATHLAQDMWGSGDGIMALYPFTRRMYGWALTGTHGRDWVRSYLKGPVYKVEIAAMVAAAGLVAVRLVFGTWP